MRTILIIQSLIILAGAYYIYTLAHPSEEHVFTDDSVTTAPLAIPATTEAPVDSVLDASTTTDSNNFGNQPLGNDSGMEFPIPDDESLLQVR
jgi:hypothetical protein